MSKGNTSDNQHFLQVYKENKDTVYRICCYYLQDVDDRKDLFQDIWSVIFKNLETFEGRSSIRTWIFRIATNNALMAINKLKRIPEKQYHPDSERIVQNLPVEPDPKINLESDINRMLHIINTLPVTERTIISLVLEESSGKEIAEVTGLSEENVRVRIHRIKKKLAEEFKKLENHV